MLLGDQRHFPAVLLVPDFAALSARLNTERPATDAAAHALLTRPDVRSLYAAIVDAVNVRLAQFERIKKFSLLPHEFTLAGGELTPTLKVKRRIVEDRYREEIEAMYTGPAP